MVYHRRSQVRKTDSDALIVNFPTSPGLDMIAIDDREDKSSSESASARVEAQHRRPGNHYDLDAGGKRRRLQDIRGQWQ